MNIDNIFKALFMFSFFMLFMAMLFGCTLEWRNQESDYDIYAEVVTSEYGCEVYIQRTENRNIRKAEGYVE